MIFLFQEPFSKLSKTHSVNPLLAPSQTLKPSSKVTVHQKANKPLEPKKYNSIIPRGIHFSPLKQISPILKKYSQQRRIIPMVSFSTNSPHKKSPFKALKPKPTNSTNSNIDNKLNGVSSNTQQLLSYSAAQSTSDTELESNEKSHLVSRKDLPANKKDCSKHASLSTDKEDNVCDLTTDKTDNVCELPTDTSDKVCELSTNKDHKFCELSTDKEDKVCELSTVSKSPKVSASETEVSDEVDEEVLEDEQESTAAVVAAAATTGKKHSISKKRNRHQRDLEASLALLQPTVGNDDPMVCYIQYTTFY